ncbi:type II secretion system major pseudopilin GspG [Aliikangiella sp. G2MR2-5]|uniref:type II secretion system major pseudopilin GspG n=1 Tax=Aliikangiella sp. G2MR2-5 TaxID=2788943 RepID=UPI0018AC49DA|nr:type II secretion system major pseudopilin GspG [Aliikangiella sp. G2MR2-5]
MEHNSKVNGFSLLEILIAMAIMTIIGGIMVGQYWNSIGTANFQKLKGDLSVLESALIQYHADNFMFPTTEQGLQALVSRPDIHPHPRHYPTMGYLPKLGLDPWGNPYQYNFPGEFAHYDIYSLGRDGEPGGEGEDADIGNWNIDEAIRNLKNSQ